MQTVNRIVHYQRRFPTNLLPKNKSTKHVEITKIKSVETSEDQSKMSRSDEKSSIESKDEVDFIRKDGGKDAPSNTLGYHCQILNKKRISGSLYGDCEVKTSIKSSLSSLEKFSLFKVQPRKKSNANGRSPPPIKEKPKFVKSASIARLLGNNYNMKKQESEQLESGDGGGGEKTSGSGSCASGDSYHSLVNGARRFSGAERFQKCSKLEDMFNEDTIKEFNGEKDISVKALRTISRGLGKLWWKRTHSVEISTPDPEFKVSYLGNVLTGWAKGEGCVEKPLNTLWRNHTQNHKPDVIMRMRVCASGLKATTRQHGLTEYWANRITHCCSPKNYPRVFCWVYRHEGRKLKHEMRCHAVLCSKESIAQDICNRLRENLEVALREFKREKISKQNARLSLANAVYENPSLPRRKILLSVGGNNYRPPLERSKSAPKLMAIEEAIGEEDDEDAEETNEPEMPACCQKDSLYPAMTLGRRRCRRGHSIRRTGKCFLKSHSTNSESLQTITKESSLTSSTVPQNLQSSTENEGTTKALTGCHKSKSNSSLASEEDELDKLLSRHDYDINSPLSNELLSYFDMKLKPKTSSLTNLQDLNIVFEATPTTDPKSRPRPALSLDNLDSLSDEGEHCADDEEDDESDDMFYRQSAILNLLQRESIIKGESSNIGRAVLTQQQLFDSDEGSISSGCETASTVTANMDDSSLKFNSIQQPSIHQDKLHNDATQTVETSNVKSSVKSPSVSFKLPNTNANQAQNVDGEVSDSEFSDESGYVEFQDTNLMLRNKSVAV